MSTESLRFKSTNHTWTIKAEDAGYTGYPNSGQLSFYNGATKLLGINELGWTQTPNVPAFYARNTTNGSAFAANSVMTWNDIHFNVGNHFSNGTTFTAPIDGVYFFAAMMLSNANSRTFFNLRKNGTNILGSYTESYSGSNYQTCTISITYQLNAGDYVDAYNRNFVAYGGAYSNFTGHFIG